MGLKGLWGSQVSSSVFACSFPPVMTHSSGTSTIWAPHWSLAFTFTSSHNGFSGLTTVTPTLLPITCSSGNSSARLQDPVSHASFTAVCHYHVGDILQNSAVLASIDYRYIDVCVRAMGKGSLGNCFLQVGDSFSNILRLGFLLSNEFSFSQKGVFTGWGFAFRKPSVMSNPEHKASH